MALFSRKTKKETIAKLADTVSPAAVAASAKGGPSSPPKEDRSPKDGGKVSGVTHSFAHVLHNPRITEKASRAMEGSTYVFDVAQDANKKQISSAVQAVYKVKPRKVAIVNIRAKTVRNMRTGKSGIKGGGKKAYVFLNKGETITIT